MSGGLEVSDIALLSASWCNIFLWTVELGATSYYFRNWKPSNRRKSIISFIFLADALSTGLTCASTYRFLVKYVTSVSIDEFDMWFITFTVFLTLISSIAEESFLIYRCWCLTKNRIIVGFLICIVTFHAMFSFVSGLLFSLPGIYTKSAEAWDISSRIQVTSVVLNAVADLVLTGVLICLIPKMKGVCESTTSAAMRLFLSILACGAGSALVTVTSLIFLFTTGSGYFILYQTLGRCYTLTLLLNFITDPKPQGSRHQRIMRKRRTTSVDIQVRDSVPLSSIAHRRNTNEMPTTVDVPSGGKFRCTDKESGFSEIILTGLQSRKSAATLGVHFEEVS